MKKTTTVIPCITTPMIGVFWINIFKSAIMRY